MMVAHSSRVESSNLVKVAFVPVFVSAFMMSSPVVRGFSSNGLDGDRRWFQGCSVQHLLEQ